MRRLFPIALLALALTGPALADSLPDPLPGPPPKAPPSGPRERGPGPARPARLFLSPAGEPFRMSPEAPDGLATWFAQADTAHAGYLDKASFEADAARFFKKLDENGDGVIDGFELRDYERSLPELTEQAEGLGGRGGPGAGQASQSGGGASGGSGGGQENGGRRGRGDGQSGQPSGGARSGAPQARPRLFLQLLDEPEPVADADYSLNSRISLDEWMHAADQRFDLLDAGHSGRLTLDQLRAKLPKDPTPKPPSH
ncbi:MAG TPA: hypothetical protein VGL58_05755 [Caulobacteraceae bacterium]|jgi:hypothetical protein